MDVYASGEHRVHFVIDPANPQDVQAAIATLSAILSDPSSASAIEQVEENYFSYDTLRRLYVAELGGMADSRQINLFGQMWGAFFRPSRRESLPMSFALYCQSCDATFTHASEHPNDICGALLNPRRHMLIGGHSILDNREQFIALDHTYIKEALKETYTAIANAIASTLTHP